MHQSVVDQLVEIATKNEMRIVADSQSSSQIGDISRFKNADLITPTEREARLALRNTEDGLVVIAQLVCLSAEAKSVTLKLGEQGVLLHGRWGKDWETDQIPALNSAPQDVAGAGDCMLVATSLAMSVGANMWSQGCLVHWRRRFKSVALAIHQLHQTNFFMSWRSESSITRCRTRNST